MDQRAPTSYKTHHDNIAENVKKFANGKFCKDEMQLKMKCKTVERKLISNANCTFLIDAHFNSTFFIDAHLNFTSFLDAAYLTKGWM